MRSATICGAVDLIVEDGGSPASDPERGRRDPGSAGAAPSSSAAAASNPNAELRTRFIGKDWAKAKVRGTPYNTGKGLEMAFKLGAQRYGLYAGCHATPMDLHTPDYGNLDLPHLERKHYRKICYFLGIMVNANGERFVDEGKDFRNYTYAQFGRSVLEQPNHLAWQIFDAKVDHLLYSEYKFHDAHFVEADTLDGLIAKLDGIEDKAKAARHHRCIQRRRERGRCRSTRRGRTARTRAVSSLPKSNWAQRIDTPPFKAYPVTGGITFTYGGLKVSEAGGVVREDGHDIPGLYACGEMVGGVFFNGYPGGSGLTSGAVFGRRAGYGASRYVESLRSA